MDDFIGVYDDALTAEQCDALVKRFDASDKVVRGQTGDGVDVGGRPLSFQHRGEAGGVGLDASARDRVDRAARDPRVLDGEYRAVRNDKHALPAP